MKSFSRRGDGGDTDLPGGERCRKDDARIEACGAVDELNAAIGALVAGLPPAAADLLCDLARIQTDLLALGSILAVRDSVATAAPPLRGVELDAAIERLQAELPPLRNFLVPGGTEPAARAHVARTVCRRAERRVVTMAATVGGGSDPRLAEGLAYLNRLSDFLYAVARACNARSGVADRQWAP